MYKNIFQKKKVFFRNKLDRNETKYVSANRYVLRIVLIRQESFY